MRRQSMALLCAEKIFRQCETDPSQWEDPAVDMEHLNLTKDDSVLCITSA